MCRFLCFVLQNLRVFEERSERFSVITEKSKLYAVILHVTSLKAGKNVNQALSK